MPLEEESENAACQMWSASGDQQAIALTLRVRNIDTFILKEKR